jgi:hypothetical protein
MKLRILLFAGLITVGTMLIFDTTVSWRDVDMRSSEIGLAPPPSNVGQKSGDGDVTAALAAKENMRNHEETKLIPEFGWPATQSDLSTSAAQSTSSQAFPTGEAVVEISHDENALEETHWIPLDWFPINRGGDSSFRLESDFEMVWDGTASASIRFSGAPDGRRFGGIGQVVDAEKFLDQRVRFSGHLKTDNRDRDTPVTAALWIRADDESGAVVAFQNTGEFFAPSNAIWSEATIVIDIPPTAATLWYGSWITGDGLVWVDGLNLEMVDISYPLTALPSDRYGSNQVPENVLDSPSNLSFENVVQRTDP